ncbi:MAG: hypothetical protein HY815_11800, partial [Candidatus Riflebacteria bacterium]|nr:hypothetical protein [Candidatus Riflebacteria bacterium]
MASIKPIRSQLARVLCAVVITSLVAGCTAPGSNKDDVTKDVPQVDLKPTIVALTPNNGPLDGANTVQMTGSNLNRKS